MRVAVIGSTGGWHAERLERALTARGHECAFAPVTRMVGRIDGGFAVRSRELALDACDVVIVRAIPRGSLEQIVFRVDTLHALAAVGVRAVNGALAIEHTIDKFLASALLAAAGVPDAADRRLRARRRCARGVRRPRLRRHRQAAVRLDGVRDGAGRGPGRRTARVPRARDRAGRLLPPGDAAARRRRRPRAGRRRPRGRRDRARRHGLAGEPRARRERPADRAGRRARAAVRAGRGDARHRLRRRRPAARRRRARLRDRGQRHPRLAGRRERDGGRRGGGARRAPESARSSPASIAPPCSAVATSAPDVPAAASARRSAASRTPPPASSSTSGKRRMQLAQQRHVGPLAGADAREVEHDRLPRAGVREARERVGRVEAGAAPGRARAAARRAGRG